MSEFGALACGIGMPGWGRELLALTLLAISHMQPCFLLHATSPSKGVVSSMSSWGGMGGRGGRATRVRYADHCGAN